MTYFNSKRYVDLEVDIHDVLRLANVEEVVSFYNDRTDLLRHTR